MVKSAPSLENLARAETVKVRGVKEPLDQATAMAALCAIRRKREEELPLALREDYWVWVCRLKYYPHEEEIRKWGQERVARKITERKAQQRAKHLLLAKQVGLVVAGMGVAFFAAQAVGNLKITPGIGIGMTGANLQAELMPPTGAGTSITQNYKIDAKGNAVPEALWILPDPTGVVNIKAPFDGQVKQGESCFEFHSPQLGSGYLRFCNVELLVQPGPIKAGDVFLRNNAQGKTKAIAVGYLVKGKYSRLPIAPSLIIKLGGV